MTASAKKWPKTWKKGWRNTYRGGWAKCQCGIYWKYNGREKYHGKKQKTWTRHWPKVSNLLTVWSDIEVQENDCDCWSYLRRHSHETPG